VSRPTNTAGEAFVYWLRDQVVADARGDLVDSLTYAPAGYLWLGRLAPEQKVLASQLGERAERMDPCATGFRVLPTALDARKIDCRIMARAWLRDEEASEANPAGAWRKTGPIDATVSFLAPDSLDESRRAGSTQIAAAFASVGATGLSAEVQVELESGPQGPELVISVVNTSPLELPRLDTNLYEVRLEASVGPTRPFHLDTVPGSFRYDLRVAAYGINGGVAELSPGSFATTDYVPYEQRRPEFWDGVSGELPDLSFASLARDPMPALRDLVAAMGRWGAVMWAPAALEKRRVDAGWTADLTAEAGRAANGWANEVGRVQEGVSLLGSDPMALRAFRHMNGSFAKSVSMRHKAWRPFQLGFILTQLPSLARTTTAVRYPVDVLRFPTGGGKTETYLGLLVMVAFLDRLSGKREGITGWARFPLRMLSLQQTQRFADVLGAAELVRRAEGIEGASFSLGFLVGERGTPNAIKIKPDLGEPRFDDPEMPGRYQVLLHCPYCGSTDLQMKFDQATWALQHRCNAAGCPGRGPLPFYVVDQEIFRFLPTVVVGTLDKAAAISWQAAMRGLYGPPFGKCSAGHGFTYARRSSSPKGCLFPDCKASIGALPQAASLYSPSIRIQDELHLLRDSLGAVDAHYEALLDHLQAQSGRDARVLASSATIEGYENQIAALYRRDGRVFPQLGPFAAQSFWAVESQSLARMFVGLAPRGATIDFASDRTNECLQRLIRRALADPVGVAASAGVDAAEADGLVSFYGVDVVYGSTLKDVEAAARSFETQFDIAVNSVTLTGGTPLEEVREVLERLGEPEPDYMDRIHLVAASSMLSHGVDVDRLNVMVMLGLPLATAEFIQTTSRVGRLLPGLVFVMHKIGRERDHKVFRSFAQFVEHADRLVDPVPITRRSRRVLELTFPGLVMGRLLGVHEPAALAAGLGPLTTPKSVYNAIGRRILVEADELKAYIEMLDATAELDEGLRSDLEEYVRLWFRSAGDFANPARFASQLLPRLPMRSLRDVEAQVPVFSRGGQR